MTIFCDFTKFRPKIIDSKYELVEFHSDGFSSKELTHILKRYGMQSEVYTFNILNTSLMDKIHRISRRFLQIIFLIENMMQKIPLIKLQLGVMLIIGKKNLYFGTLKITT